MEIKTFKRFEEKYIINQKQRDKLIQRLQDFMVLDRYCQNGEKYKICNIYYDTEDNEIIRHSVSKPYYKEKLRLRSYGTPESGEQKVFLELKKKIGGVVNKRRVIMTLDEANRFLDSRERPAECDYLSTQVLNEIEWHINHHQIRPAAYISYDRTALFGMESFDSSLRVTFDNNIITRRYDLALSDGCYGEQLLPQGKYLMEVKISGSMPFALSEMLSELGIFSQGFSKYGTEYKKYLTDAGYGSANAEKCAV